MIVLGIDPGIGRMGWAIISSEGSKVKAISFDCLETDKKKETPDRLVEIYKKVESLVKKYKPDALSIEELFFNTNTSTAMVVGQARGVAMVCGARMGVPVFSYTPLEVKMAVTGYGRAEKAQVGQMVKVILSLPKVPTPDDTADALAVAITHAFSNKMVRLGK